MDFNLGEMMRYDHYEHIFILYFNRFNRFFLG